MNEQLGKKKNGLSKDSRCFNDSRVSVLSHVPLEGYTNRRHSTHFNAHSVNLQRNRNHNLNATVIPQNGKKMLPSDQRSSS